MKPWSAFEMKLYRELKVFPDSQLREQKVYLGLSGGADSLALALGLKALSSALGFQLLALHCHHGEHDNREFREQSLQMVVAFCSQNDVTLKIIKNQDISLKSEEELRNFRRNSMLAELSSGDLLALAHHQDDLLETRLMRLIRGTGDIGITAMTLFQRPILRPFLGFTRAEIEEYLIQQNQSFMMDPSRSDFRSFIRHKWLPELEKYSPGAKRSFARSLEVISLNACKHEGNIESLESEIDHAYFLTLSATEQMQVLARYISSLGIKNYSRAQVQEIVKNLDKSKNVHTFKVAGLKWDIDAKKIRATPYKR